MATPESRDNMAEGDAASKASEATHVAPVQLAPCASSTQVLLTFRFVSLSPWSFRLAWLGILVLHGLCAFYFALSALMYDKTPGSVLEIAFVAYKVGMPMEDYRVLTRVHAFFAAIHILLGGLMVAWSLGKRRFSFGPLQELSVHSLRNAAGSKVIVDSEAPLPVKRIAALFARRGFFGVEGAHFDEILAVREIVESALQAYQAYRMSQFLVRPWLNRFYVGMLVVNCWMAPLVHLVFHRNELPRTQSATWGFPNALWYDDVWTVKILSEFQIMLVMSWGDLAIIVLHVYAESTPRLEQCLIQVNPWLERKPACLFLEWDCHINHDSGDSAAITAEWAKSSPTFVQRIMILHCSAFVMPTIFVSRHELTGLKMYNTTIADWGAKAAITESNHPAMMMAYFVRVNMSHTGSLPPGLMTSPFPRNLADIELAVSNLHVLPIDLDTLWPPHMFFFCDHCQFATLPPVLSPMSPYWVTFAVNPFSAFPFEVFQIAGLEHFQLGGVSLPLTPPTADESFLRDTTVRHLYLAGTNLTWLPRWVDTFASLPRSLWYQPALDLTATPLCDAIGEMQAGRLDRFPAEWTANVAADQVSRYMYVERSNLSALASVVMCNGLPKLAYPLDEDDVRYSV
ncbi:hypothetical protein ATCC90586_001256 [Pythium insidiosum]|nr:hypothetical protein ATCC90586_001256 [Pythium insidiosum]